MNVQLWRCVEKAVQQPRILIGLGHPAAGRQLQKTFLLSREFWETGLKVGRTLLQVSSLVNDILCHINSVVDHKCFKARIGT